MSDLHLINYINEDRPQLQDPSVTELPLEVLGPELSSQLRDSFTVNASDGLACAVSARLWESLLEKYRLPYLLLRAADMRMTLGSKVTALALYEELQTMLEDPQLDRWILHSKSSILAEAEQQLFLYKNDPSLGFSPSQRWRPMADMDAFPYCKLQRAQIATIRDEWNSMSSKQGVMDKLLNMHCLETNYIEGTFLFDDYTGGALIRTSFYDRENLVGLPRPIAGAVRDMSEALSILQDTHEALNEIFAFLKPDAPKLTVEMICCIHAVLMRTSRVLDTQTGYGRRLTYLNIGITRQTSRVNVTAGCQGKKIQFCPYDKVDEELKIFCERFNELVGEMDSRDPFASAAWISHVFVAIHPFEDGNGRMSRILASIPLVKSGLPLICIPAFYKTLYIQILNSLRANRDGDYTNLMEMLHSAADATLCVLRMNA